MPSKASSAARLWLRLVPPANPDEGWLGALVGEALASGHPLDVSSQPALWGGAMRGCDAVLIAGGGVEVLGATSRDHAADLLHAHLIQVLSSVGREHLDVLCLPISRPLPEQAVLGALAGARAAQAEGLVGSLALTGPNPDQAATLLSNHSDLEFALVRPEDVSHFESTERLVVMDGADPGSWLRRGARALVAVSSPEDVRNVAREVARA
ncbi:MAG: hypothetical protein AMXMBFR81_17300 [Chthonomonas sp.]